MTPWTDRAGNFSPLKTALLICLLLPAAYMLLRLAVGTPGGPIPGLGARPITELIHRTGDWAIRFLLISLAVTPARRIFQWPKLIIVRRMLGLGAFFYALAHFILYITDQKFRIGVIASEIALRFYLTIGFIALLSLAALAVTSTDAAIRRLGKRWNTLHQLVYPAALLAALHYFIQTKLDVYQATLLAGFLVALFFYRTAHKRGFDLTSIPTLAGIAVLTALITIGLEYAWYALATNVPPMRVLMANLQFNQIRPAWWVLSAGLTVTVASFIRNRFFSAKPQRSPRLAAARD